MSDSISEFGYIGDRQGFEWSFGGSHHQREFENQVVAVPLKSGSGLLVVEPASDDAPHNATLLDASGELRSRIENPEASNGAICFCDAYYIGEELALTIAFASYQMRCFINEQGQVLKVTESR